MRTVPAIALALAVASASARATDLPDPEFGSAGQVLLPFDLGATGFDQAYAVLPLADGGLLLGGAAEKGSGENTNRDMALARLRPDGSLDPAFGSGGRRTIAFDLGGFSDSVEHVVPYPGNRFLGVGIAENVPGTGGSGAVALIRFGPSGALDTSFDLDGRVVQVPTLDGAAVPASVRRIAVQDDGRMLVIGTLRPPGALPKAFLLRLLGDGSVDANFGEDGRVLLSLGDPTGPASLGYSLALRPDGRILVGGAALVDADVYNFDMFIAQLLPDGSLDPDFGVDGVRFVAFDQGGENTDAPSDLALDAQGRAVLAGYATTAANGTDIALARILPGGSLDPSFGTGGRALVGFDRGGGQNDVARALGIDAEGRILVAGACEVDTDNVDIALLRLDGNGQLDPGFGSGGQHVIGIDAAPPTFTFDSAEAMSIDTHGRVVVAGTAYVGPQALNYDMLALRFASERLFGDGFETAP